ncbi:MAG TPA: hypothetical protein VFT66_23285, partial [Roseiflexaceae bacterium]|nr:hypothetical protein [Roseiflexaceae bacterium]
MNRTFKTRRQTSFMPNYIVLSLLAFFALAPLVILGFNALKSTAEVAQNPLGPPSGLLFSNFPKAWQMGDFATTTRNSAILVIGTVIGELTLGGLAAYSLARLNPRGSNL